jgi:hypothetical protein
MMNMPPGTSGLFVSLGSLVLVGLIIQARTPKAPNFTFDPRGNDPNSFEPRLANYVRAVEFLLGLATGSIVLIVGSSALHPVQTLPWQFVSPLCVLAFCVVYGLLFMVQLIRSYEEFLAYDNFTRSRYIFNTTLGFSALACFCGGYIWLVLSVGVALTK